MTKKMTSGRIASGILAYAKKNNVEFLKSSLYRLVAQNTETFGNDDARIIDVLKCLRSNRGNEYLYIVDGSIDELINDEQTFLVLVEILRN